MTDTMLLGFLMGILCIDAVLVTAWRMKMNMNLAFVRILETVTLITVGLHTTSGTQIAWYIMTAVMFLYNSWFAFATDDDLAESGPVGRWLVNTSLEKMKALEKVKLRTGGK